MKTKRPVTRRDGSGRKGGVPRLLPLFCRARLGSISPAEGPAYPVTARSVPPLARQSVRAALREPGHRSLIVCHHVSVQIVWMLIPAERRVTLQMIKW
jgi:hypothetical protein